MNIISQQLKKITDMKQILFIIISIFLFIGCNDQEMENITLHTQDIELQDAKKAIERLIAKPLTKGESPPIYTLSLLPYFGIEFDIRLRHVSEEAIYRLYRLL